MWMTKQGWFFWVFFCTQHRSSLQVDFCFFSLVGGDYKKGVDDFYRPRFRSCFGFPLWKEIRGRLQMISA